MTLDVTSLLGVLPVTAREITRDETSISWRKVKLRLSVSRSNAPSPESVHEDLPDYEDGPEASSHANDRGGAEDDDEESEEEEDENEVASDTDYSNSLPDSPPHAPSALGLDFISPIDLTQDEQQAHVLSQLAGINLRGDSSDRDSSSESRLREAEAFIASAVLHSQALVPSPSPLTPLQSEPSHEHENQSTTMTVRRVGPYETTYTLSNPDPDSDDEEGYFEISRPGIARWSSSPPSSICKPTKTRPVHRELSLHPRISSFLSAIPRYHRTYGSTWFKQNSRVKRVLDVRKRRHASNLAVRGIDTNFVKKAVERSGPSWRPRLPSVFAHGLRKKEKADDSAFTVDTQVSSDSRSLVGEGIERPGNVPRIGDPQLDAYTRLTVPSTESYAALSAMDNAPLSIRPDAPMAVQGDEEVPECIVVPSTPPPSRLSLVAPQPQPSTVPLPYLVSQANLGHGGQGEYPYVATPPLDSRNADSVTVSSSYQPVPLPYLVPQANSGGGGQVEYAYIPTPPLYPIALPTPHLTREASLPTPRLTREASFASSNVPTPESGRVALPTLGVPAGPEYVDGKSVKYGSPARGDAARYEYVATPPLPSLPLASTPSSIVPPRLSHSFTPLHPPAPSTDVRTQPHPITPITSALTLPSTAPAPPPPPLTAVLPSFPVGQPPPPLPPLQPIIPPTLTPPTFPSLPTTTRQPPPLTTVLPSFPVGHPPPPLPPLIPPLVPSLSVPVPLAGTGYMRSSLPPSASASAWSGVFHPLESQMVTQQPPLQSSSMGSGSSLVPTHSLPPGGQTPSATATAPALRLQTQIPLPGRIPGPEPESMDCEEDAYAPLIKMTSPTEQPSRPDFVMGEEGGLYAVARPEVPVGHTHAGSLDGEVAKHGIVDVHTEGPSHQGASSSGFVAVNASTKDGTRKYKATGDSEDGLDGDPPPFDESDPLWEELLAYKENPDGDVPRLGSGSSSCVDAASLGEVVASTSQHAGFAPSLGGDPANAPASFDLGSSHTSWTSDELSWDFSDVLNSGADNPPDQPQSDVWKELCAWADEQPPELLESVFGMLDTASVEEPSVEPVGFADFPPLEETPSLELAVPAITVEPPTPPLPSPSEYYTHPQLAQDATDFNDTRETGHMYPSGLEASTSFTLDELDWAVMEEYAQLEYLECPDNSVDAARIMVVSIRAVAAKAKTGFAGTSEDRVFLPPAVIDFPAGCGIAGGQSVSPSYEYVSLLDDVQVPVAAYHHHQAYPQTTSLPHVLAAS